MINIVVIFFLNIGRDISCEASRIHCQVLSSVENKKKKHISMSSSSILIYYTVNMDSVFNFKRLAIAFQKHTTYLSYFLINEFYK